MKFYAVRKGREMGIFENWTECKASVEKFPGAEYKSFTTKEEALRYLFGEDIIPNKKAPVPGLYFDGGTGLSASLDENVAETNLTDELGNPLLTKTLFLSLPENIRFGSFYERDQMKTILFKQADGFTNNFAELYGLYLALCFAGNRISQGNAFSDPVEKERFYHIYGDSELVIRWWSTGHVNINDEKTVFLSKEVMKLRLIYENNGGRIIKISGDINPADLGFHK